MLTYGGEGFEIIAEHCVPHLAQPQSPQVGAAPNRGGTRRRPRLLLSCVGVVLNAQDVDFFFHVF
jgi:hypothetical protein